LGSFFQDEARIVFATAWGNGVARTEKRDLLHRTKSKRGERYLGRENIRKGPTQGHKIAGEREPS